MTTCSALLNGDADHDFGNDDDREEWNADARNPPLVPVI
jgi:hypothetical protein